jgi:hypothetical protein
MPKFLSAVPMDDGAEALNDAADETTRQDVGRLLQSLADEGYPPPRRLVRFVADERGKGHPVRSIFQRVLEANGNMAILAPEVPQSRRRPRFSDGDFDDAA